jgi:hypothetical protein
MSEVPPTGPDGHPEGVGTAPLIVEIGKLRVVPEIYPRKRVDPDRVAEFVKLMTEGVPIDPITVTSDLIILDGVHRYRAALKVGLKTLLAVVDHSPNPPMIRGIGLYCRNLLTGAERSWFD